MFASASPQAHRNGALGAADSPDYIEVERLVNHKRSAPSSNGGDYFEPDGNTWGPEHAWAIETWAENEIAEGMCQLVLRRLPESIPMPHLAENSDGAEIVLIKCIEPEYDGIELTNSMTA